MSLNKIAFVRINAILHERLQLRKLNEQNRLKTKQANKQFLCGL